MIWSARTFLLVDEEPALRIFGNLHSDRIEYNVAYLHFLEKNTNSGLNSFDRRHQQVLLGNVYLQDFFFPGYAAEFVAAWNKDDPSLHYDDNGFLVRPAPIGNVINQNPGARPVLHGIRVGYFGWLGSGRIHRLNLTHALYQAIGEDLSIPSPDAASLSTRRWPPRKSPMTRTGSATASPPSTPPATPIPRRSRPRL